MINVMPVSIQGGAHFSSCEKLPEPSIKAIHTEPSANTIRHGAPMGIRGTDRQIGNIEFNVSVIDPDGYELAVWTAQA